MVRNSYIPHKILEVMTPRLYFLIYHYAFRIPFANLKPKRICPGKQELYVDFIGHRIPMKKGGPSAHFIKMKKLQEYTIYLHGNMETWKTSKQNIVGKDTGIKWRCKSRRDNLQQCIDTSIHPFDAEAEAFNLFV
jgi:hypothetical protein